MHSLWLVVFNLQEYKRIVPLWIIIIIITIMLSLLVLLLLLSTNSMDSSPSLKANWFSASQETPCIL